MFRTLFKNVTTSFLMLCILFCSALVCQAELVKLEPWNEKELAQIISSAGHAANPGDAIVLLSNHFKNTPYAEHTLIGGPNVSEELVINLSEFDCFTFLDVVESLRRSSDFEAFAKNLKDVRYFDGIVAYEKRRHFFSDWVVETSVIEDVTEKVSNGASLAVQKHLNLKAESTLWLPGIDVTSRQINYIPTTRIGEEVLSALQPGDYVGIYSDLPGLDVSHTGLIVVVKGRVFLRHASSRSETNMVVDEELLKYLQGKPGLIVYRVKP
jgi:hypothetical protein